MPKNPSLISLSDLIAELSAAVVNAGGQVKFAERANISQAYVNDLLAGKRTPGKKILAALGYEKVVMYRRYNHNKTYRENCNE